MLICLLCQRNPAEKIGREQFRFCCFVRTKQFCLSIGMLFFGINKRPFHLCQRLAEPSITVFPQAAGIENRGLMVCPALTLKPVADRIQVLTEPVNIRSDHTRQAEVILAISWSLIHATQQPTLIRDARVSLSLTLDLLTRVNPNYKHSPTTVSAI